ncbi:hypothetical protein BBL17_014425 [Agrobacterium vitis]|uniref:Uncharacterized protein n=1 Tax=Agrobacterium vitis TaxID=373 RepID=A0ABW9TFN1_AGRVI|nr:hypothetical protein [Agrobacterium vitis]
MRSRIRSRPNSARLLSLLNRNMEALIKQHMIVETISSFSLSALGKTEGRQFHG